ncbi:MAG: hypothetical protein C6P37_16140 [Caldibacillus debilis]|uniref:Uncharacterized protein n=1 Tax=Caldibacillus debilis TaxID=301148 RepID=A0A3E0JWC8_9BACI|nr:hypothetical protein [Bacillaceae bacterium]OUM91111.1 MAG: hypothetical protein BAA03_14110 [Caldibacillus debilis]REJ14740.1 MAG: hypothetical protein C6W57_13385 [Caldibacillus debilis]REJ23901.1 MAG: hypothetical protein C6W56_14750 [Caldibacillus debilis]REJ24378.1 MAG: hypothetical protein C6P37_16140 [Caldibacillus debilis]
MKSGNGKRVFGKRPSEKGYRPREQAFSFASEKGRVFRESLSGSEGAGLCGNARDPQILRDFSFVF